MTTRERDAARAFLKILRTNRRFKLLVDVAAACGENDLKDPQFVIWQAQGLIETGKAAPILVAASIHASTRSAR